MVADEAIVQWIAWWTMVKENRSARAWAIAASLIDIAWTPLVANCTDGGARLLALTGIRGLLAFVSWPRLPAAFRLP